MRKTKTNRAYKKLNRTIGDDFYSAWLKAYGEIENISDVSNKRMGSISEDIKKQIDKDYIRLRVDEKFIFYLNFYKFYEDLTTYFEQSNEFAEKHGVDPIDDTNIEKILGYEVAFSKKLLSKAGHCLKWFYTTLLRLKKHYGVLPKDMQLCFQEMKSIVKEKDKHCIILTGTFEKECNFLNGLLIRIKYIRDHIDVIYGMPDPEFDKKTRAMIKNCATQAENTIKIILKGAEI